MPSVSTKQARFMRAVAHGWKPPQGMGPPVSVAREFEAEDRVAALGFGRPRKRKVVG